MGNGDGEQRRGERRYSGRAPFLDEKERRETMYVSNGDGELMRVERRYSG